MSLPSDLPVVDVERLNQIFADLGEMDVKLDGDPLEFGPKRMNGKVAKARTFLSWCERIFLQVSHDYQLYKRTHGLAQLQFELQTQDLLANDPHVRAGRNLADRNALATMRLKAEREVLIAMEVTIQDLEMVLTVVKAKRADLRDIQVRLAQQQKLCEAELSLGSKWGSKPGPETQAPDLDSSPLTDRSALDQIQDMLDGEVHLKPGDETWMAAETPATPSSDEDASEVDSLADDAEVDALLLEVDSLDDDEDDDEPPISAYKQVGWCGVPGCGLPAHRTPSGTVCASGHGGAPVLDQDPKLVSKVEPPKVESPKVEPPKVEPPKVEPPPPAKVETPKVEVPKKAAEVPAQAEPAEVNLDSLFGDEDPPSTAPAMAAVTTDSDVDALFSRMSTEAPKAKNTPPPVEEADIDSLIDMFST